MSKRVIALSIVLSLVFSTAANAVDSKTMQKKADLEDPFALMYDSDIGLEEIVTQIVAYSEFTPVKELDQKAFEQVAAEGVPSNEPIAVKEPSPATNLRAKDITEIVMQSSLNGKVEELQELPLEKVQLREIERAIENSGETHYIIKYKNENFKSVDNYLDRNDTGAFSVTVMDTDETSELLVFENSINPQALAKKLKANNFGSEIEYIQPDYKIGLATEEHFSLDISDNDADKQADADTTKPESELTDASVEDPVEAAPSERDPSSSADNGSDDISAPSKEDMDISKENGTEKDEATENIPPTIESETPVAPPELPVDPLLPEREVTDTPVVALIDTGVDITHPDIADSIWEGEDGTRGWNFLDDSGQVFDSEHPELSSHGTHIAGIIAKNSPNAKIMVLKAFARDGAYTSDIIDAIRYAEEHGASVVNCSFVGSEYNKALEDAIAESNMLFITAAGNHHNDLAEIPVYPACFNLSNIICVASVNADGGLSYFSNYGGSSVDIAAIGGDVESCLPENESGKMSGTSMSAAQVTGAAAAVLETAPALTTAELHTRLLEFAQPLSNLSDMIIDGRMVDVGAAVADQTKPLMKQNSPEEDFNTDKSSSFRSYNASGKNIQVQIADSAVIVLKDDGTVWAWGEDQDGICGDVSTDSTAVHQIIGLRNIKKIAAGPNFCLALRADGSVWSWGGNRSGQLGLGSSYSYEDVPNQIYGLTNIVDISAGKNHALAVRENGRIYAWGSNADYQLGDGTTDDSSSPVRLSLRNIVQAAAGDCHSLMLDEDGQVWGSGTNSYGEIGDSTTSANRSPGKSDMTKATFIAAGTNFSLAIDHLDELNAWGRNRYGQLGRGTTTDCDYPVSTDLTRTVKKVAAGGESAIALTTDGNVWTWGDNVDGQLGVGTTRDEHSPVRISELSNCIDVDINGHNGAAIQGDGTLWIWGSNDANTLGLNQPIYYIGPTELPSLSGFVKLSAGDRNSVGITSEGYAYAWGENRDEMLNPGSDEVISVPSMIDLSSVEDVALGSDHASARRRSGRVYSWGRNNRGQLGDDDTRDSSDPVRAVGLTDIVEVDAGTQFGLALDDRGYVYAWGYGRYGQLGNGDTINDGYPTEIADLTDIAGIAAGRRHGAAFDTSGRTWTWGYNNHGQLGDGTFDNSLDAYQISYPRRVEQIDAGDYFTAALDRYGDVWTWGYNNHGQLGYGKTTLEYEEADSIPSFTDVKKIAAGDDFCLALKADGTVWGWGNNNSYQMGRSVDRDYTSPVQIKALSNIVDIAAGSDHSFAIDGNGKVYGWGSNRYSQLGIPRMRESLTPMKANSYVEDMYFSRDAYAVDIPTSGNVTTSLAVYGNTATQPITPAMATYSLAQPYSGVTLSANGTLTVSAAAQVGRVKVNATCNGMNAVTELVLMKESEEQDGNATFSVLAGEEYDIAFVAQNVQSFAGKTFTLTYDSSKLTVTDLCSLSYEAETTAGKLERAGITVTQLSPGKIVFTVEKEIAAGQKWSGSVNVFSFKASSDGDAAVSITQTNV